MAKFSSPARICGRKNDFCSSVPKRMMVGPTVLMVTKGNGAPARRVSSKKMNWSVAGRPCPPNSLGHPMPSQPSLPIWRTTWLQASPPSPPSASPARTSSVRSSRVVPAQLGTQLLLFGALFEEHRGAASRALCGPCQVKAALPKTVTRSRLAVRPRRLRRAGWAAAPRLPEPRPRRRAPVQPAARRSRRRRPTLPRCRLPPLLVRGALSRWQVTVRERDHGVAALGYEDDLDRAAADRELVVSRDPQVNTTRRGGSTST